ncbi:MAG: XRE family transcriptional regulator [Anaerolineaceae bacterium]|nr:MAG: XRE family transcriptional regulator [Anaerolineaceae bacterium]
MKFHIRLKQLRLHYQLTQSDLADILGLKATAISNYESQRNEPSFEKLIILSEYFDVSCDYLLGVTDSYLPVEGEVLDKDILEVFDIYQQLDQEHVDELKKFAAYLLYKQNLSI